MILEKILSQRLTAPCSLESPDKYIITWRGLPRADTGIVFWLKSVDNPDFEFSVPDNICRHNSI